MDDYVAKPITALALLQAVSRWGTRPISPERGMPLPVPPIN